jgi:hypothetical protein
MNRSAGEQITCFLCDYGLFVFACLIVGGVAVARLLSTEAPVVPPVARGPAPVSTAFSPVPSPETISTDMPAESVTPTALPPVISRYQYTLAFIPLNWQGSHDDFSQSAQQHADFFINRSGIQTFFDAQVLIVPDGLDNQDLSSGDLVYDIMLYASENQIIADRYVGLTDGDLSPDGHSDVVGWTIGEQGMVVEAPEVFVTAHELGHTFGLCDEYSYTEWVRQNEEFGGCPNKYPPACPRVLAAGSVCEGYPAPGGENSMMGPAGLPGDYAFNQESLDHIHEYFQMLVELYEQRQ